ACSVRRIQHFGLKLSPPLRLWHSLPRTVVHEPRPKTVVNQRPVFPPPPVVLWIPKTAKLPLHTGLWYPQVRRQCLLFPLRVSGFSPEAGRSVPGSLSTLCRRFPFFR